MTGEAMPLNINAFRNTLTARMRALPIVVLYVTEECNLRCVTCSYRKALPGELSLAEIRDLAGKLHGFGLKHIAFSGGEPLTRRDFPLICEVFRPYNVRQTLLTNGVLLGKRIPEVGRYLSEIVVSVDGADAGTHDSIRGAPVFERIVSGIHRALDEVPGARVSIRTVVQKRNFRQIPAIVGLARSLGVHHVSFLAADMTSEAFGHARSAERIEGSDVFLDVNEALELHQLVKTLSTTHAREFRTGFIAQSPEAMSHIAAYYAALCGLGPFPTNACNAPNVSAVITSTGEFKPCFFLPALGNIRATPVDTISDSMPAQQVRQQVKARALGPCKTCVCTLHVSPAAALLKRF